jgi:hypothetical protein
LVLREGFELVAIGLVMVIGAVSCKSGASEIYGLRPLDPLVLASVMALLGALPWLTPSLRRATRDDPMLR